MDIIAVIIINVKKRQIGKNLKIENYLMNKDNFTDILGQILHPDFCLR